MLSFVLPFIVLIIVVVFIHEYGHYYFAKRYGVGVTDFSIGFGQEIFGWNCADQKFTARRWIIPKSGCVRKSNANNHEKARYTKSQLDAKHKLRYDNGAKELKKLQPGTMVWIQDAESGEWGQKGIIEKHVRKRAYLFRLESGMTMHRNREGSENDMMEPGCHQLPSIRMLMKRMKKISIHEEVIEYKG